MCRAWLLAGLAGTAGCARSDEHDSHARDIEYLGPNDVPVEFYASAPPQLDDTSGEFLMGIGGHVGVWQVLDGATVELYVSLDGEGPGPCTFEGGVCAGITTPELVAMGVASVDQCETDAQL